MINIQTATPIQIDTQLLREMSLYWRARQMKAMYADAVHGYVAHQCKFNYAGNGTYRNAEGEFLTTERALQIAPDVIAHKGSYAATLKHHLDLYTQESNEVKVHRARINELNEEFTRRGGWTRYWAVVSSAGHVHSSTECFTCNNGKNPTEFVLFPSLSGKDVDAAVAKVGATLCSHCFPTAPVEYREQAKVSKTAAQAMRDSGDEKDFDAAVAKAAAKAAASCGGSGKAGLQGTNHWQKCTECDYTARSVTMSGKPIHKLPRHKPHRKVG